MGKIVQTAENWLRVSGEAGNQEAKSPQKEYAFGKCSKGY